jgi:hypothetical protein
MRNDANEPPTLPILGARNKQYIKYDIRPTGCHRMFEVFELRSFPKVPVFRILLH